MSTTRTFILVALACAVFACSGDDPPTTGGTVFQCVATGEVCKGDTVCTLTGCEAAFPRDYQLGIASISILGKPEACIEDPECPLVPDFAVYFSGTTDPVLDQETSSAEISVVEDNFLIVEIGESDCVVELTASVLRGGSVACSGARHLVSVSIAAL
jgi:hypothetical protein